MLKKLIGNDVRQNKLLTAATVFFMAVSAMIIVIFLAAVVVLLVALLCIRFILSIRMERDKREVGMLKALGVGKRGIKRLYFSKYILFSVCGALLGLGVSNILQGPLGQQIRELYGASDNGAQAAALALCAAAVVEAVILLSVWHNLKKTDRLRCFFV